MLYVERIKNSPWRQLYGEKRDVLKFRPFGCRAWMFLNKNHREKGKTAPRAVEVVNLGFCVGPEHERLQALVRGADQGGGPDLNFKPAGI